MPIPVKGSYPAYYEKYIDQIIETNVMDAIHAQQDNIEKFLQSVSEEKSMFAYAEGKWTLKELLQHVTDTERVFIYRAMCVARGEKQSLPGFDEDMYAANSNANARSWKSLAEEFLAVRQSSRLLFESFTEEMLNQSGTANNRPIHVNAIGFILVGHALHHMHIARERYF